MTSNDGRERLDAEIPEETKQLLHQQDGFMWECVTEAVHNTFGGERLNSDAALDREIELVKRKKRNAYERVQDAEEEYTRLEQRLASLEQRREEQLEQSQSKTDALDDILQSMVQNGHNIYSGHGRLESLAVQWFNGNEDAALAAVKNRNEEASYNLPEARFERPGQQVPTASNLKSLGGGGDSDE